MVMDAEREKSREFRAFASRGDVQLTAFLTAESAENAEENQKQVCDASENTQPALTNDLIRFAFSLRSLRALQ